MVALTTPEQLPPPDSDGLPTDAANAEVLRETLFWLSYRLAQRKLDSKALRGTPTVCLDLAAGSGVLSDEVEGELSWSASLLGLQLLPPDHTYVLHSRSPEEAAALGERARMLKPSGGSVFEMDLDASDAYAEARDIASVTVGLGPKVVVTHGGASQLVFVMNELLSRTRHRRLIARSGALTAVPWTTLAGIVDGERSIDLVLSLPLMAQAERRLSRLRTNEGSSALMDEFYGTDGWLQLVATEPRRASWLVRALYLSRLRSNLGLRVAPERPGLGEHVLRGRPVFASTSQANVELWARTVDHPAWLQDELYLDSA
jgi:hypothetical protein